MKKDNIEIQDQAAIVHDNFKYFVFIGYVAIFVILTYLLPDEKVYEIPYIKELIGFMGNVLPSVENLGKYSNFPQTAQLMYCLGILSMPLMAIFCYYTIPITPNIKILQHRYIFTIFIISSCFIGLLLPFVMFSQAPHIIPQGRRDYLIISTYNSRIDFIIATLGSIGAAIYFFLVFIKIISALPKILK